MDSTNPITMKDWKAAKERWKKIKSYVKSDNRLESIRLIIEDSGFCRLYRNESVCSAECPLSKDDWCIGTRGTGNQYQVIVALQTETTFMHAYWIKVWCDKIDSLKPSISK